MECQENVRHAVGLPRGAVTPAIRGEGCGEGCSLRGQRSEDGELGVGRGLRRRRACPSVKQRLLGRPSPPVPAQRTGELGGVQVGGGEGALKGSGERSKDRT